MIRASIALFALWLAAPVLAAPPKDLDAQVNAILARSGTPGVAIGIVEHGKVTLAKGYGVKRLGGTDKIDADTLFQMGSVSKAFTTAALALLVEEGKIGWDDKVIDHLPEFRMADPWVTREFTIRDLLVHRSGLGLGAGDLTFIPRTDHSRAEVLLALRYLKPQTSFRTQFAYDNLLYTVAGIVIERVSGQSWEDFVRARLLRPAGMAHSTTDEPSRWLNPDRAQPHERLGPPAVGLGAQTVMDEKTGLSPNAYPAGGIMSSANDMVRWIGVQLAHGKLADGKSPNDKRLWSEAASREMWTVVTPTPIVFKTDVTGPTVPQFAGYALGWGVQDYHGERIVAHTGGTIGFVTRLVMVPGRDTGFIIMQNSMDSEVIQSLQLVLLDHYLGVKPTDWGKAIHDLGVERNKKAVAALTAAATPAHVTPPSLPLAAYVGDYRDPWYGGMTISLDPAGALSIDFRRTPGMVGTLLPYTGDTFIARWHDVSIEPAYVRFTTTPAGGVERILMSAVSPIADFSFDYQDLEFVPRGK